MMQKDSVTLPDELFVFRNTISAAALTASPGMLGAPSSGQRRPRRGSPGGASLATPVAAEAAERKEDASSGEGGDSRCYSNSSNPSSNPSRWADAVAGVLGGAGATSLAAGLATSANRARVGRGRHAAGRGDLHGRS